MVHGWSGVQVHVAVGGHAHADGAKVKLRLVTLPDINGATWVWKMRLMLEVNLLMTAACMEMVLIVSTVKIVTFSFFRIEFIFTN